MTVKSSMFAVGALIALGLATALHAPAVTITESAPAMTESAVDFMHLRGQADAALKALVEKREGARAS